MNRCSLIESSLVKRRTTRGDGPSIDGGSANERSNDADTIVLWNMGNLRRAEGLGSSMGVTEERGVANTRVLARRYLPRRPSI